VSAAGLSCLPACSRHVCLLQARLPLASADRPHPVFYAPTEAAAAQRLGVQGGGVAGDPGAAGRGGANIMTDMSSRLAGGASETAGRDMRPMGTQETPRQRHW
jgi:hypothetical protein